jgi:hypothetical protein
MDTLKRIEKLFEQARQDETPVFHVSHRVMADLAALAPPRLIPLSVFAGVAAAAAVVMFLLSVQTWNYLNSPLAQLLTPLQETSLW